MTRSPHGTVQILTTIASLTIASSAWCAPQLTAIERAKLVPDVPLFIGHSGSSVAACGDLTVVGAPEENVFFPTSAGRAAVHRREGSRWFSEGELTPLDGSNNDAFGTSVAIGEFSLQIVVGSPNAGPSGAAYIFARQGDSWVQEQKIVPPDSTFRFGHSVDMRLSTVVAGAPFDSATMNGAGAAYVHESGQFQKLTASDLGTAQIFGWSVALDHQSGNRIVVGAPAQPDADTGTAYVFRRTPSGWVEEARLSPSSLDAGDKFGWSVAIQGTRIAVSAPAFLDFATGMGSVFVFEYDGVNWLERPELFAPTPTPGNAFGASVSIEQELLAIGTPGTLGPGSVHIFEESGFSWVPSLELFASDGAGEDSFGNSVDMGGDWLLVGAVGVDEGATQAGAAYTFEFGQTFATPYCFGDGSGTACPCGNESLLGSGEGCRGNEVASRLRAFGSNDVTADDLRVLGDFGGTTTVLLFSGNTSIAGGNGIPFGGGLLCVTGDVRRLGARLSGPCGLAEWGPGLANDAGWSAGQSVQLQSWVRAPGSGCNAGFTFSSALEVMLAP